jgi:ParB/RepB/Spo0J family partition protein
MSQIESQEVVSQEAVNQNLRFVELLPEEILIQETTNVRPYTSHQGETEEEIKALNDLMTSIEEEGQIQPIRVALIPEAQDGQPRFKLIAGRRRHRAVTMHNMALAAGVGPLKLQAVVEVAEEGEKAGKTAARQFRRAAHENLLRRNINPVDFAMDIQQARGKFRWEGTTGTEKLANFFKVSPAQISQHEKLLNLAPEVLERVAKGELTKDDAFRLERIQEKKGSEAAVKTMHEAIEEGENVEVAAEVEEHLETAAVGSRTGKKKKVVKKKAVAKKKAAAKSAAIKKAEREADPDKAKQRSKKEVLDFFASLRGPAYGYPNGAVWQFVDKLFEFAAGKLQERTLIRWFDAMVEKAPKGTADSVSSDRAPAVASSAKGKAAKKK